MLLLYGLGRLMAAQGVGPPLGQWVAAGTQAAVCSNPGRLSVAAESLTRLLGAGLKRLTRLQSSRAFVKPS